MTPGHVEAWAPPEGIHPQQDSQPSAESLGDR